MHYNGDTQMADINQQEREEFQALIRGHGGDNPRSFTASAGVQSSPVGGFTPVGQAIGAGIDTVSSIAKNTADALSTIASTPISVKNTDGTETVSPFGQQGNLLQSIGQLGQSLPNALPAGFVSNTDRLFLYNNEQLRANEALRIAKTLNIGADTVMFGDDRAFERADYLSRRVERGQVLQDIYDEFPELYKVKYSSQAEGIQALNNLESIKNTKGVFDAMQQSIWAMNDQMKLGDVGFALAHESDPQKISELTDEINRLQNNIQSYRKPDGSSPLEEVLGATSSQGYMMAKQGGLGAVAGAVAGALIGGLATEGVGATAGAATGAKWGGGADMAYNMYKMSFGNKYVELIQKKDANGNRVYTDQEANQYAMSYAAIDAGIEFAATAAMGKAVKAVAPKGMIAKAISAGVGDTVKTFDRGIGTTVAQMAKNSIKAGLPELFEEGLQDVNEKVQHNLTRKDNDLEGYYSVGDIAIGSLDAMKQALPAVIGFGAIGGAVGGVRTAKAFRDFQKLTPEQQQAAIIAEQNRNGAVIMDNVRKDSATNKIAKENPELYGKIVQAQGDKVGVSTQYVDVAELVQSENGQLAIRDMVDNGLVTQEEVKAAIEADAPVEIPIGSYAQVSMNLSDETVDALKQTSYFTRDGMSLATLERAKQEVDVAKSVLKDDTSKRAERIKDDIIRNEFEGASDIDREVLNEVLSDPTNIKRNYNNLLHTLKEQYRETYASDFDNADKSINDAVSTGIEPQWLTDYKANNGGKAPRTNAERRRAAYEYSRATTTASLDGNADALAQSDAHYADMEHMLMQIESLEAMKDKVFELANNDIALRMQLSKSGYDVYNEVVKAISESTNRKQRETAKANALLMAQHADIMAQYMRQMGRGNYTAMDYLRDTVRIKMNAVLDNQKGYNQLNQDARLKLSIDKKKWSKIIDNISSYKRSDLIRVMDTPAVMQLIGVKNLPIKMYVSKYWDIKTGAGKNNQHKTVTDKMWKQLPSALVDPIAIFPSKTVNGSIVIMTEITDSNKKQSVVALELSASVANNITINRIKSFYPKDNANANTWFYNNFTDKNNSPLYINEQKTTRWFTRNGLQLPYQVNQSSGYFNKSIPNENDLDNYRNANSNIFYQSVNGMTEIMSNGERIIKIFKRADRSTFLHEMGHVFFDDIQKLASMENAPEQLVTDWNKLKEWSGWVDGENVDNTKAHEKFARGWESYLRSGEAPTSALQRVFRQFSKWLTYIYRSVQRLGGEVPSDIKDVMARMLATQEDIEAYAEQQQLEQFEKTELYKQLSEQDQARMQSYIADVKEKAKERVMRKLMKELDNRPIKEWEEEKDAIQIEIEKRLIEQYPIYKEHQRYNVFGEGALKDTQYNSIEELEKAEVEQTGATFNDAINQEMDNAKAEFMKDNNVGKTNEQIAEEILLSTQGQMKLTEEESKIIQQSTNRELAKNWELLERIRKLDPNAKTIDTELSEIEKEVKPTKYDELKADKRKVDAALTDATKELEKAEDRIKRLEDALQERINNVRSIRGAGLGTISDYMNRARKELGELPISNAVQFKTYQNKAVTAGKKADRTLASGNVDKALGYKREQMLQQARARVAFENFEKSKKLRLKLKQQLQRMTRPKNPIAIEPNMRYFYAHMAYQMGLTKYDGLAPTDGFDMNTVLSALDVDALILNQQSTVQLHPWIAEMFYAKTPKSFKSITMNELETLEELMTGMYKNGRNEYEGTTILNDEGKSVSFDNAVQEIIGEATETFGGATGDVFNILNNQTKTDAVSGKLYGFHLALMKVETFLRRMGGGKNGFAVKYIYDPISRATQAFNERKEVSMRRLAKDVGIYSKRELFNMRNEHLYTVGNLYGLTKEQLIMIALNWGTESNRQRVMETTKANEVEIERAFQEHMTDKDWEFVIRTWDHINSFFDERSKVQEELYGNPLKKVEGLSFSIGGRNIEGQYFPIVYNPKVNASVSDNQVEDIAKTMVSSNAVWGIGMSATKSRLDVVKDKSLLLDFDVIPNAITEAINHVTMRKAVTDVNKLISNRELQNYIVDKFGVDTYQFLRTWVRDNWQDEPAKTNDFDRLILTLKKNTDIAVMAGRVSVALQNVLNIPVAFYRIGVGNTIRAINHAGIGFYGHGTTTYNNTRDFVLEHSIFMRERVQTLDKDLKQGLSIGGKGLRLGNTNVGGYTVEQLANVRDDINQMGFRLLTETDFALSIPVWKFAYDQKQAELIGKEGVSPEWIEQQSIEAGDRAVRDIFGSGDTKDAAAIQRARSSVMQMFVPFYSYANTLYNIITEGNYARKDTGDYARFVKVLWWSLVAPAIGMMAYKAMTNGDDDKPEDLAKSFIEELVAQGTMGVPLVRDITNMAMKFILGERPYNKGNTVLATSIAEKLYDVSNAIVSDKKDGIDVGRSFSQLANRATGFSDTVTDGLWTLARYAFTDTDAAIEDVIMAIAFDRRLKTKKDKKKH